eukprot:CAMPEP_0117460662 /NCGR_PEP_ID=MMETSP0784-20121206/2123_1 /TAXON_ID=39447 /ORGANISM="" /LENGTH=423 /DNA_ID=CAMNT_0005254341 /DNA_START=110 /DNA_END=1377 /DNA_ORIENTATION=+
MVIAEKTPLLAAHRRGGAFMVEFLVVACCALDAADKVLLPSCFKGFQQDLGVSASALGVLTLCQTLAFSVSLPFWGKATEFVDLGVLLSLGCAMWGAATWSLAMTFDFNAHCLLRVVNGAALGGMTPISQAALVEIIPADQRGAAFGRLGACCGIAAMLSGGFAVSVQGSTFSVGGVLLQGWQAVHRGIAAMSLLLAVLVYTLMPTVSGTSSKMRLAGGSACSTLMKFLRIPSFVFLVLQGVTGGVPANAMSFMPLYWTTSGFGDGQAAQLAMAGGVGSIFGNLFSGYLGDAVARRYPDRGRIFVAIASVICGIPLYVGMFYLPAGDYHFAAAVLLQSTFGFVSCWTPAATNRPICAELVRSPAERAQILSWWLLFEGVSMSIMGAPLVGYLSERFGYNLDSSGDAAGPDSSRALAQALVGVG